MSKRIQLPNLFLLGAAKCGTTTLHHWLRQHPQVFFPEVKEPSFFCDSFQVVKNPLRYFRLFDTAGDAVIRGDASHVYFSDPESARVINALFPEARFLLIFRNPADRAYSLYNDMRRNGYETAPTFERALALEEERTQSKAFRLHCPQYLFNFFYYRSGLYGKQLERYTALYPRERFHWLTLDDLRRDPAGALYGILKFLGVDLAFEPDFALQNEGRQTARWPPLEHFWRTQVTWPPLRARMQRVLRTVNRIPVPPMNPKTRDTLMNRFKPDLDRLYGLTSIRF